MTTDKIAEIRKRHRLVERFQGSSSMLCPQSHDHRGILLAEVERLRADRRERIATAALQGLLAYPIGPYFDEGPTQGWARRAVEYADALIAELDKEDGR